MRGLPNLPKGLTLQRRALATTATVQNLQVARSERRDGEEGLDNTARPRSAMRLPDPSLYLTQLITVSDLSVSQCGAVAASPPSTRSREDIRAYDIGSAL
jgi:hypothetical protein